MVMSPSLTVGLVLSLPIMSSLDFPWPNWILYLFAVLFVIDSRVCWSSMLLVMIATSSTHRRHVELGVNVRLGCTFGLVYFFINFIH